MTDNIWQISQGHLNIFSACPRKFQSIYLEKFTSPYLFHQQSHLNLGNRFHRLMQQRELGLPIEGILREDEALKKSYQSIEQAAPNIVHPQPKTLRKAEHRRTILREKYLLIGIYDLLILSEEKGQIVDWKTYPKPHNWEELEKNWQTRLYLYLLAETSDYSTENIQFTYWFINGEKQPTSVTFKYNQQKHEKTEEDLNHLLSQLSLYWEQHQDKGKDFPQVEQSKGECVECPFKFPCDREEKD